MAHPYNDPGTVSPASPYDDPTPCPECGIGDAEYGVHERGCPSGYPTVDATEPYADGEIRPCACRHCEARVRDAIACDACLAGSHGPRCDYPRDNPQPVSPFVRRALARELPAKVVR